jgi:hypothetical protein
MRGSHRRIRRYLPQHVMPMGLPRRFPTRAASSSRAAAVSSATLHGCNLNIAGQRATRRLARGRTMVLVDNNLSHSLTKAMRFNDARVVLSVRFCLQAGRLGPVRCSLVPRRRTSISCRDSAGGLRLCSLIGHRRSNGWRGNGLSCTCSSQFVPLHRQRRAMRSRDRFGL